MAVIAATLTSSPASAETTGPPFVHVPVTVAPYGQNIAITATTTCPVGAACSARLFYRTTTAATPVTVPTLVNPSGFQVVPLTGSATTADSQQAVLWTGEIPGTAATSAGVDYYLEAEQNGAVTRFPGTTYANSTQPSGSFLHIHVLSPPLVNHVPVPTAVADQPMGVDAQVSCSSGNCQATLWYRRTPLTLDAEAGWSSTTMNPGISTGLGGVATLTLYHGEVPASSVDTTGVDYYIHVTDGHTQAFSPGTTYEGWYTPTDGTHSRAASYHVHVLEPPRIVHAPPPAAPYRQDIPILAETNCPTTRTCTATLWYRTTPPGLLNSGGFSSTAMTVTRVGGPGVDAISVQGAIPAGVVDTRGVDYFFSITDGTTTSWWPGTSAVDGPGVWVNGIRVAYHHVRALEPPHLAHVPPTVAQPFTPLLIQAELTCATESCGATLHYSSTPNTAGTYQAVTMTRSLASPPNPATRAEVWEATIPASAVTSRGLAYYMTATDGYTNTAAPGTFYWGAYAPLDGSNPAPEIARFVVRVVDPPHPLHVPVGVTHTAESVTIEARSNCIASCTAILNWRHLNGSWQAIGMGASVTTPPAYGNSVVTYSARIPGSNVISPAIEYRIDVTDGYVTETSPPYALAVTDRPVPRAGSAGLTFVVDGQLPTFPCNDGGCGASFGGTGTADGLARAQVGDDTLHATFTMPAGSVSGSTTYTEPGDALCPAAGFAEGTAAMHGSATGTIRRSTAPAVPGTVTGLTVALSFSYERVGGLARIGVNGGTATLSYEFPDTGNGSFTTSVLGAGAGAFVVNAQDVVARCATQGALLFEVIGALGVVLS